jgi:hypothetical protein
MINPGSRPSRLALGRHAVGERKLDALDEHATAYLANVEAERARTESFDFEALRARSERLSDTTPARPAAAAAPPWWRKWLLVVPVLAMAVALFVVRPPAPGTPSPDEPANRIKGDSDLGFFVLRDDRVYPGDPDETFRAGDRLQFTYRGPHARLVLLSVDGAGRLTLFYPEAGEDGVAIVPGERHVLDGSIILDDAPGPEVFVGFFGDDWTASRARAAARAAWEAGGSAAVVALAEDPTVSVLALERE